MVTSNNFFLILGMHRSGTSCLSGCLSRSGVNFGQIRGKGKFNRKGYYEIREVQELHDQALALNNCSWVQPPKDKLVLHPYHRMKLKNLGERLMSNRPCALKDPRTLLFLDTWKDLIGDTCQLIGTFRHPMAVAYSLYKRNKISIDEGLLLWLSYNELLVEEYERAPFPIIHFDMSNKKGYLESVKKVTIDHNLRYNQWKLEKFVSKELEHHQALRLDETPENCKSLFAYLLDKAQQT